MRHLLLLIALASAGHSNAEPMQGVVRHEVVLDVMHNGKKAGTIKLPPGREVAIIAAGATQYHIKAHGLAQGWVEKEHVTVATLAAVTNVSEHSGETKVDESKDTSGLFESVDETPEPISPAAPETEDAQAEQATEKSIQVINPGELVFLQLPFSEQERGGICAGSSLLNIADYMHRRFQLTQTQFFSLFDSGSSGANVADMEHGLRHINYTLWPLYSRGGGRLEKSEKDQLVDRLIAELNDRQPLSISRPGHAFVLVGYNMPEKVFYAWDQNKDSECEKVRAAVDRAPKGVFEIPMAAITSKLDRIDRLVSLKVGELEEEGAVVSKLASIEGWKDLCLHILPKKHPDGRKHNRAAGTKVPLLVTSLLSSKREVAIPSVALEPPLTGGGNTLEDPLTIITGIEDNVFVGIKHPEATEAALSKQEVTDLILENGGRYWSYFNKSWKFQPRK
jgi:hypothetical protein